jgi:ribose transport system ATP-binding protein
MPQNGIAPGERPIEGCRMTAAATPPAEANPSERPLLQTAGLSKRFTATLALDSVDFEVRRGEVHALLGQNGAGKSTLIKILAGVYPADAGHVLFDGEPVRHGTGHAAIAFIHQDLGLVDGMTVAENIAVTAGYPRRLGAISWRGVRAAGARALALMGSRLDPDTRVGGLTAAEKSIVAIARALAVDCALLVLDEPTAALPEADVAHLLDALRRLRDRGIGIVYVSHRLDEVFRIADRVTVLRDGRKVRTAAVAEISPASLVFDIVGRALDQSFVPASPAVGRPVLEVEHLVVGAAGPVSFAVAPGEVLGLVGLRGAGHDMIGRAVFGAVPRDGGTIRLDGQAPDLGSPAAAMAARIGFVSSKRGEESLAATMTVRENLFLNPTLTGMPLLAANRPSREVPAARRLVHRFSIRPGDPERVVATLSGGNQQKVVVARWLDARIRLLVLEEPTTGVDVGSKAEIYALLREALAAGMGVLLVSSDFEEVERICHRALVFDRGRLSAEIPRQSLTVPVLTMRASGQHADRLSA